MSYFLFKWFFADQVDFYFLMVLHQLYLTDSWNLDSQIS